jgi:DNA-binding transcriptional LysR family regulator
MSMTPGATTFSGIPAAAHCGLAATLRHQQFNACLALPTGFFVDAGLAGWGIGLGDPSRQAKKGSTSRGLSESATSSIPNCDRPVWAAADTFDLVPGAALPLALYRERSVCREAALAALNDNELTWQIIYTSPSLTGVRAAALAGLAITPISPSSLIAGLRILGVEEGLPPLPDIEFAIYEKARPDKAAAALAAVLLTLARGLSRSAI